MLRTDCRAGRTKTGQLGDYCNYPGENDGGWDQGGVERVERSALILECFEKQS